MSTNSYDDTAVEAPKTKKSTPKPEEEITIEDIPF